MIRCRFTNLRASWDILCWRWKVWSDEVVGEFVTVKVEDGGGGVVEDAAELVVEGELEAAVFEAFDFVGGFHVDGLGVEG